MREIAETVVWAFLVAFIIRYFVIEGYYIPSSSMAPTLVPGNRVLVAKFYYRFYRPQHGDIIVFRYPSNKKKNLIKRVMALPGETIRIENGLVYINGVPLQGDRFNRVYFNTGYYGKGEQAVPENSYFVLGDNSRNSDDSRFWGYVPLKNILGRAFLVYWPPRSIRVLR
ncbi:MAG: signal peptidase I [Candidatus Atribacteria bacterium]|nr:signal peptidase I [Candidatus Atribacteria bacterium]